MTFNAVLLLLTETWGPAALVWVVTNFLWPWEGQKVWYVFWQGLHLGVPKSWGGHWSHGHQLFLGPPNIPTPDFPYWSYGRKYISTFGCRNPILKLVTKKWKPSASYMATEPPLAPWLIDRYGHQHLSAAQTPGNHISQDIIFYGCSYRFCIACIPSFSTFIARKYAKFDKKIPL